MFNNSAAISADASYGDADLMPAPSPPTADWSEQLTKEVPLGRTKVKIIEERANTFPAWLKDVVKRLNQIAALPENWDSYGAPRVDQRTLEHALSVLTKIMDRRTPPPRILATPHGGVKFGWYDDRRELEITVDAPLHGEVYFFSEAPDEEEVDEPFNIDYGRLTALVERFAQ